MIIRYKKQIVAGFRAWLIEQKNKADTHKLIPEAPLRRPWRKGSALFLSAQLSGRFVFEVSKNHIAENWPPIPNNYGWPCYFLVQLKSSKTALLINIKKTTKS